MKKIAIFLTFVLVFTFTSCGSVKEKTAEKIEEKVSENVKKVEKEMAKPNEKSDENIKNENKESVDKESKKDEKKSVAKKDKMHSDAEYREKTLSVIANISKPEYNDHIKKMLIEDLDNDGDIETLTIVDYSEDYKIVFLMNFDDFEKPTTIDFEMSDMIVPVVNVVDINGVKNKVLYLDYDMDDKNRIELYEITEEGFKTLVASLPKKNAAHSSLGYPRAHVNLLDKDDKEVCVYSDGKSVNSGKPYEYIDVEYSDEVVLYSRLILRYKFMNAELRCMSGKLTMDLQPKTPADTVMQYLELQHIKSFIFEDGEQIEIDGLSDRLAEISDTDADMDIWSRDILLNTTTGLREGRGFKPKFIIDEDVNGDVATVVLTLDCDESYVTMRGKQGSDFKAIYHLEKQDNGNWKIVSSKHED